MADPIPIELHTGDDSTSFGDNVKSAIGGFFGMFRNIIFALFFVILFFVALNFLSSERTVVDEEADMARIESEDADAVLDLSSQSLDMELYSYLRRVASGIQYGAFDLDGKDAEDFGAAVFPQQEDIKVRSVHFAGDADSFRIEFDMGVNRQVVFSFNGETLRKTMTRYEGFTGGGGFFRFLGWYVCGQYATGYPRYTSTVQMNFNGYPAQNTLTASKTSVKKTPMGRLARLFSDD